MKFLSLFSPMRAWRDLRFFLVTRRPHQIGFLGVAAAATYLVLVGMMYESRAPKIPYHREIIYVEQWRADRSDAEIIAQQKIDGPKEKQQQEELARLQAERRAQFKKVNDGLKAYGL